MPNILLRKLRDLGSLQLAAVRKNDLDALEKLEAERREALHQLGKLDIVGLAEGAPELVDKIVQEIRDNDHLVRFALRERMEESKRAMDDVKDRGRAERAYRGIAGSSR
jgi:hypothetical protein